MIDRILLRFFSFLDSIIEPIDRIFEPYYPTDGIVVKIVSRKIQLDRPDYWQMAIKY